MKQAMQGVVATAYNGDRVVCENQHGKAVSHKFLLQGDANKTSFSYMDKEGTMNKIKVGDTVNFNYEPNVRQHPTTGVIYNNGYVDKASCLVNGVSINDIPIAYTGAQPVAAAAPIQQAQQPVAQAQAQPLVAQQGANVVPAKVNGATVGMALNNAVALIIAGKTDMVEIARVAHKILQVSKALESGKKPHPINPDASYAAAAEATQAQAQAVAAQQTQPVAVAQQPVATPSTAPVTTMEDDFDDDIPF